jgi:hypothetical protein
MLKFTTLSCNLIVFWAKDCRSMEFEFLQSDTVCICAFLSMWLCFISQNLFTVCFKHSSQRTDVQIFSYNYMERGQYCILVWVIAVCSWILVKVFEMVRKSVTLPRCMWLIFLEQVNQLICVTSSYCVDQIQ